MKNVWFLGMAALLSAGGYVTMEKEKTSALLAKPQSDMAALRSALQMYKINNGHYPSTRQGLEALVTLPSIEPLPTSWSKLCAIVPVDPWGTQYRYALNSEDSFILTSAGRDLAFATEDDDSVSHNDIDEKSAK